MMSKYMQVIWLYLIGIAIIFIGLFMLSSNTGPSSFLVMLMGLAVAAIGAAHGRRMRMLGQLDINQLMQQEAQPQDAPEGEAEEAPAEAAGQEQVAIPDNQPQPDDQDFIPPQKPMQMMGQRIGSFMGRFRRAPTEMPLEPEDIYNLEMEDIKKGKIAATRADVIMLVCPKCMAENEEQNYYCYKCGNKLRRKPVKEDKKSEIAVEPGTISVVDDRRVAKVMICPKCNMANKVGDKFCWNCGKKIRSDSSVKAAPGKPKAGDSFKELDSLLKGTGKKTRKAKSK